MKEYNIKAIRQEFKDKGVFYTPPELALYLKSFLPDGVDEVYDPTCGAGGLLSVFDDDVIKYGQDINAQQVEAAKDRIKNFNGEVGDTLKEPAFFDKKFKYIIANPPFSIKWEPDESDPRFSCLPCLPPPSKADYAFIAHILYYLADDGMAIVMNFPGILYRGQREGKIRRWLVENNYIEKVIAVDGNKFVDTKIATCVLVLNKNKADTNVTFVHNNKTHTASLEEIAQNDFCLSVSIYIEEEIVKEEIDPLELGRQAREGFLKKLRSELDFERAVCEIEGLSIVPFLDSIKAVVDEYY